MRYIVILTTIIMALFTFSAFATSLSNSHLSEASTVNTPSSTDKIIHVVIVGPKNDAEARKLYLAANTNSIKNLHIVWWDRREGPLANSDVNYPILNKSAAYVCYHLQCSLPIFKSQDLTKLIEKFSHESEIANINPPSLQPDEVGSLSSIDRILTDKSWFLIIIGFMCLGALLSFSPCILPLIPIMASIIVGQSIGVSKERTFLLTLAYVLAMAFTYSALGLIAGIFGMYLQVYLQKNWIIILFGSIFFFLALSMLANHDLQIPRFIQNKINERCSRLQGGSYLAVIGMGILATLIVSPCVTAPLAGVLTFITKTGDYIVGGIALFFMGIGIGSPLLVLSMFGRNILPKVVRWNRQIKNFFGLVLLGMSIWLLSRVISEFISFLLWSGYIILTAIYMGIQRKGTKNLFQKFWKTITIMIFTYGIGILLYALFIHFDLHLTLENGQKFIEYSNEKVSVVAFKNIHNSIELENEINIASSHKMPVILDFTAEWCSACVAINKNIFSNTDVLSVLNKFTLLRIDLTDTDNDIMQLSKKFNVVAPPVILFFNNDGKLMDIRANGDININEFTEMTQRVLNSSNE